MYLSGQFRLSKPLVVQIWLWGRPMTGVSLGSALMYVPQEQLSRAIRPAHFTLVMLVPAGAVKAWPEKLKPPKVAPVSRSLIPEKVPPPDGHVAYVLPAFANGTQAALLWPKSAAESQETTVYGRPSAALAIASHAHTVATTVLNRMLMPRKRRAGWEVAPTRWATGGDFPVARSEPVRLGPVPLKCTGITKRSLSLTQ